MSVVHAKASGIFPINGVLNVHRLGFGAMRITGKGIWGPPANIDEAKRTLRRAVELGTNLIDTADSYGPFVSEELIAEALSPYPPGLVIATKGGLVRNGPETWLPVGRPEYLRQCVLMSLRRLKLEHLQLWQLHRIDPKVPRDEQFGVMAEMQREGLILHLGLSEVSVEEIEAAGRVFKVATVQNLYNLVNRQSQRALDYCAGHGIGFIPWFPLAAGSLAAPGRALDDIARKHSATPSQVALAWLLRKSLVMLPIPGTSQAEHVEENIAAGRVQLSDEDFLALDEQGAQAH
jgi:aryl-alcohol dehydrogenase-like predicted oxidoreductase